MGEYLATELQAYLDEQSQAGLSGGTISNRRRHCRAFLEFCSAQRSRSGTIVPSVRDLKEYAKLLWTRSETEATVSFKISIALAFCKWLAERAPSSSRGTWKVTAARVLAESRAQV